MKYSATLLLLAATSLAGGPLQAAPTAKRSRPAHKPTSPAGKAAAPAVEPKSGEQQAKLEPFHFPRMEELTPLPSGPGLVVFPPTVPAGTEQSVQDLTTAAAQWLSFHTAHRPRFGKTPGWSLPERVARELGKKGLRLPAAEAVAVCRGTGATHFAVGTLRRMGARWTLSYQLFDAQLALAAKKATARRGGKPSGVVTIPGKPLGAALTASGTADQLVAGLPKMAREMARTLGEKSAPLPKLSLSSEEMILLGKGTRSQRGVLSEAELARLTGLLEREPLADVVWLTSPWLSRRSPVDPVVSKLVRNTPDTPLVWALAGRAGLGEGRWYLGLLPDNEKYLEALRKLATRYPNNYLLAVAQCSFVDSLSESKLQSAPVRAVRAAPGNRDSWLLLGESISGVADSVRQGRFADAISKSEWLLLNEYYRQWAQVAERATQLSPKYGYAWLELAKAQTFDSKGKAAREAFWKAHQLMPHSASLYQWGVEMFHDKWGGTEPEREKLFDLILKTNCDSSADTRQVSRVLKAHGYTEMSYKVADRAVAQAREEIAKDPEDDNALYGLAMSYHERNDRAHAIPQLQEVLRLRPDRADRRSELGEMYLMEQNFAAAAREFAAVKEQVPESARGVYGLGRALIPLGKFAEAEKNLREAINLRPGFGMQNFWLGEALINQNKKEEALTAYQETVALDEYVASAYQRIAMLLTEKGQLDEAITAGRRAVEITPAGPGYHWALGRALLQKGEASEAAEEARMSMRLDPRHPAHPRLLGDALIAQGKKAEALEAWQLALKLDNGQNTPDGVAVREAIERNR